MNQASAARPLRRWIYLRDLLVELVVREMKLRYERSLLGIAWAIINPLAQLMIFVIIFKHVIQLEIPNYTLFVFSGILFWNWTRDGLMAAAISITANRDLIRQPGFPLPLLPVVSLAIPLLDLLVAIPVLLLFMAYGGGEFTLQLLLLPLLMGVQFLLLQGLGYLLAAAQVVFRDTSHLLGVSLMLGFYMTPIFYDMKDAPANLQFIYTLNPMTHLLTAYRAVIMHGESPDFAVLAGIALFAVLLCWVGLRVFIRASHHFAEEL